MKSWDVVLLNARVRWFAITVVKWGILVLSVPSRRRRDQEGKCNILLLARIILIIYYMYLCVLIWLCVYLDYD